ncbi:hypothetical protein FNYG_06654 [Fusarium nygamai]|uniref:chitin synthase n=1 Tax=Gibberella nygamai TaxID=42673 RepID=A0A2K0WCF1_GIBNY|nr:hypothetical protein FNYG_06654 [Fusarium nygamai]
MDPLSIISGCAGLITAIGSLRISINTFVRSCREARSDLDGVSRELHSLQTVLQLIEEDAKDDTKPFPPTIQHHVSGIVTNCGSVVSEVQRCIKKYGDGRVKSKAAWAINGQGDMEKLRSSLEAHKSALELALDMLALSLTKDIKNDTTEIRGDTAAIKDDTALILLQIEQLQARLPDTAAAPNDYILQKFLEDMATYTETTLEADFPYSDGMSSRALSNVIEYDESSTQFPRYDLPILTPPDPTALVASQSSDSSEPGNAFKDENDHPALPELHRYVHWARPIRKDIPHRPKEPGPASSYPKYSFDKEPALGSESSKEADAVTTSSRTQDSSSQKGQQIQSYRGNLIVDFPVPDSFLARVPDRDEFKHARFSFITCPPEEFGDHNYTLRATLFTKPRHTQFILVVQVNPDDKYFIRRWNLILDSIVYAQKQSDDFWKRVIVHLHLAHGTDWGARSTHHPLTVLESIGAKQIFSDKITKVDSECLDEPLGEDSPAIRGQPIYAIMSEV